jgi:hypothetical protein
VTLQFATRGGMVGSTVVSQVSAGRKNRLLLEVSGTEAAIAFDQEQPESLWIGEESRNTVQMRDRATGRLDRSRHGPAARGHLLTLRGHVLTVSSGSSTWGCVDPDESRRHRHNEAYTRRAEGSCIGIGFATQEADAMEPWVIGLGMVVVLSAMLVAVVLVAVSGSYVMNSFTTFAAG